jgi:hypothetical protein
MERFRIRPEIYQFDTFKEFIEDIPLVQLRIVNKKF